jgi:glucose-1-phosphate thymidylyltransferase
LVDNKFSVRHKVLQGWWIDTGKKDPLLECNRLVLDAMKTKMEGTVDAASEIQGRVTIEAGAKVSNSRIRGPVVIGAGAIIEDSYIGPYTSLGKNCRVVKSEMDHSVVLDGSSIIGVSKLTDSLIGKDVEVIRSIQQPRALRLMLGDDSKVELE